MKDTLPYQLPEPTEKLAYKFILDEMREPEGPQEIEVGTTPEEDPVPELLVDENGGESTPSESEPSLIDIALETLVLPEGKKYFRIGEVAELVGVEPYVLRYWEGEFAKSVRPLKSRSGHRVYCRKDVLTLQSIRHLLYVEKFSIKGAKKKLLQRKQATPLADPRVTEYREVLSSLAKELRGLLQQISRSPH
jgi:DNA-binding transcriptional MerR regulator